MTGSLPDLSFYSSASFDRGRNIFIEIVWRITSALIFQSSWIPFYGLKRFLLSSFGAKVGNGVLIKPRVTITLPWRVTLGNHVWIGEGVWLDSLDEIHLADNVCISQLAYLC